ncbi:uncharacterized protein [Littorina saxatilis]|uniref:SH2 domain-containing protein n=1 Tax=Littorina saxatilis TaxID=31220 RepID=A0AAN9ALV9_9CAEN
MATASFNSIMLLLLPLLAIVADTNNIAGQAYCTYPSVPEGQPSVMTFHFSRDIDKDSVGFFIYLRRDAEPGTDILRCDRQNPVSQVECKSKNVHFKFVNLTSYSISMLIQDTSKELQDNYTLQIYEKSSPLPAIVCRLTVMDERHTSSPPPDVENDNSWIAAPVIIVLLLLLLGVGILYYLRKRSSRNRPANTIAGETKKEPLLGSKKPDVDSFKGKRWFFEHFTKEDEAKLLKSEKTKPGSFLITVGSTNPNHFILAVFLDGVIKRFPISRHDNGVTFLDTKTTFQTLTELVQHYTEHEIQVGATVWGRLSKHFRKEPDAEWYFGKFTREDEDKLLQTARNKPGSFLIRDGITEPDDYVLAVMFEGAIKHFTIIEEEDGFNFRDADKFYTNLEELVDYFKEHKINVGSETYGTLTQPFEKKQLDGLYLEEFPTKDDGTFLQSHRKRTGSFLITTGSTNPNHYILAVYFDGAVKRFPISREGNGYKFLDTGMFFRTLTELMNYYKAHDIQSGGKVWGKLSERFRPEPKEEWYFGTFTRDDEQKLLLSGKKGPGSFLIRDGTTDPDNYVLAVNFAGKINHFTIIPEENAFNFREAGTVFRRLADLVDHYKEHEIVVHGTGYGKLVEPFVK